MKKVTAIIFGTIMLMSSSFAQTTGEHTNASPENCKCGECQDGTQRGAPELVLSGEQQLPADSSDNSTDAR